MKVPLLDLKAQYATLRDEMKPVIDEVMESQYFINGPAVGQLEQAIADYCGCPAAVGVSSGTDALLCSLMALGIGRGHEVITTPYTFFATAGSIWRVGARPVFVDIDPATYNLDPSKIEDAVTDRTRAIMPVHLFGQLCDMDPIMEIARRRDLAVVEDAAQAIGATCKGRKAGSFGATGCFSFFPSKNLGGLGDGGMITVQDEGLAARLKAFRNHGEQTKYFHKWVGGNFRLDTLQAAGLLVKLPYLDGWSAARRENAARYNGHFEAVESIVTPTIAASNETIFNQYVIRVPKRDALKAHLDEAGIGNAIYYPLSLHQQECFAELGYKAGDFPESERAASETIALPIYPELTDDMIDHVAETVVRFVQG